MRAARPKWLVTYQERKFDSGSHRAKWVGQWERTNAVPEPASAGLHWLVADPKIRSKSNVQQRALFDAPAAAAAAVSDEDLYGESGTTGPASLPCAQALADRLAALPFAAPLGPSVSVDGNDPPAPETVAWLWCVVWCVWLGQDGRRAEGYAFCLTADQTDATAFCFPINREKLLVEGKSPVLTAR